MSEINVNTIDKATGSTLNVGAAGTTVNIAGTAGTGFPAGTTLSGSTNNNVVTVTGANALIGETNLNFDGTNLSIGTTTSAKKILVYEGSSGESAMEFQNTGTGVGAGNGMYVGLDANENGKIYNQEANGMLDFGTANTSRLVVAENGSVGINETTPLGKLHVKKADSGGSVMSDNDALVLEGSAGIGMTLLGGTADEQTIAFGDSGDSDIGYIKYHHNTNYMAFGTNAGERMRILTGGEVIINRTSTFFGGNILQIVGKNDAEVVAIAVATNGKKAIQFATRIVTGKQVIGS